MLVVDASALIAIADDEPERALFLEVLKAEPEAVIASANYVEAALVLISRRRMRSQAEFDEWVKTLGVEPAADGKLGPAAVAAYLTFGRGYHRARLNLADCFAYALAKTLDAPLLCKGNDFAQTDVRLALQPT